MRTPPKSPSPAADPDSPGERRLGVVTATLLVVASMIGVGIFTTTGYMVQDVPSLPAILVAWLLGGVVSLFGAMAYAELAAAMPRNGGEYQILARLFHPAIGFMSAWVSLVVGFCAPIAATSLVFGKYLETVIPGGYGAWQSEVSSEVVTIFIAVALVLVLTTVHLLRVDHGSRFQNVLTTFKILLLTTLIVVGLTKGDLSRISGDTRSVGAAMLTPAFAIGLIYISYSYTGWNAAVYVAGEIRNPRRNLPIALCAGTMIVTVLYVGLNVMYLAAAPREELAGVETVAHTAMANLFGASGGRVVSLLIVLGLLSMVGALVMTGSRVYESVGQDFPRLRVLAYRRAGSGPRTALLVQAAVAVLMIVTVDLQRLIEYVGFTLSLFAALTVCGLFVLRRQSVEASASFRMPGYPVLPMIFIGLMAWIVGVAVYQKPVVALTGIGTLASGGVLYLLLGKNYSPVEHEDIETK